METIYIKARMYLTRYSEEDDEVKKTKITYLYLEDFRKRGLGDLEYVLNDHLLNYALDKRAFVYRQELRLEDLAEYSDLSFIKSILPIHIGIEIDYSNREHFTEQECPIYLYFKVLSSTSITNSIQLKQILDELSGQLSDGWGEGFEQRSLDLSGYVYNEKTREVLYIEDKDYTLSATAYCQEEVQLEVVPEFNPYKI